MSPKKTIVLRCNDGEEFVVEESLAKGSQTVSDLIEDLWMIPCCEEMMVPLPNVRGPSMAKIIVYWKKHQQEDHMKSDDDTREILEKWDSEFVAGMDRDDLIEHLTSAHYLECQPLVNLLSQGLADMIKDMKVEDATDYFDLEKDFSDEQEEKKLMEQNA